MEFYINDKDIDIVSLYNTINIQCTCETYNNTITVFGSNIEHKIFGFSTISTPWCLADKNFIDFSQDRLDKMSIIYYLNRNKKHISLEQTKCFKGLIEIYSFGKERDLVFISKKSDQQGRVKINSDKKIVLNTEIFSFYVASSKSFPDYPSYVIIYQL